MEARTPADADTAGRSDGAEATVSAHSTSDDRTVFTEAGNKDAWIATDHTVELRR